MDIAALKDCFPDLHRLYSVGAKKQPNGFLVAGRNSSQLIQSIDSINEIPIPVIEVLMRPSDAIREQDVNLAKKAVAELSSAERKEKIRSFFNQFETSSVGFLGPSEKLLDVLCEDNRLVVEVCNLSHQDLMREVLKLAAAGCAENKKLTSGKSSKEAKATEFRYRGIPYHIEWSPVTVGYQPSPFNGENDGQGRGPIILVNQSNGQRISIENLVVATAYLYGFYEGQWTPYRTAPARVISTLSFLPLSEACKTEVQKSLIADDERLRRLNIK